MKRVPVYFNEDITQGELAQVMREAGLHLHIEAGARLVVDRVPQFLREEPKTNVVRLPTRARKAR